MPRKKERQQPELFRSRRATAVITGITPLARDPNLHTIKVDGKAIATLRAGDAAVLVLEVGRPWTTALADKVQRFAEIDKARKQAMRLLSARGCSVNVLTQRLAAKGYAGDVVQQVVAEAVRDGWLNERALAEDVVRSVSGRRPAGRRLIEEKLSRHGIDASVANQAIDAAASGQDDRKAAYGLARKRLATMTSVEPATALRRIAGLLARRGFDEDVIEAAIERLRPLLASSADESP